MNLSRITFIAFLLILGALSLAAPALPQSKQEEREAKRRAKEEEYETKQNERYLKNLDKLKALATESYDKFKDRTVVETVSMSLRNPEAPPTIFGDSFSMSLALVFAGNHSSGAPRSILLSFTSHSKDWTYLKNHRLIILADDARINLPDVVHEGSIETSGGVSVNEYMVVPITADQLDQIVKAKRVEMQLGPVEFYVYPAYQQVMAALAERIK